MRVLFCATPGDGHARPMMPLLMALQHRGHTLAWAGATETHPLVQAHAQVQCFDAGPGSHAARFQLTGRWPELADVRGADAAALVFPRLFGSVVAPAMLPGLRDALHTFTPDLVVGETAALAVPLAAQMAGCLHVTHGNGMPLPAHRLQEAALELGPLWHRHTGAPPPPDAGLYRHLYLDIYPPSLQHDPLPPDVPVLALQVLDSAAPPAHTLRQLLPSPFADQHEYPLVYLSLGTALNRPDLLRGVLAALSGLPLRVVVATGPDVAPEQLHPLPPQVLARHFFPQAELMPHCQLVISHGGAGTLLTACAHGLPQLVLPQTADQFVNATALKHSGAGLALMGAEQSLEGMRLAVMHTLGQPAFRSAAARLAAEVASLPSADDVALELERTVARGHAVAPLSRVAPLTLPVRSP